MRGFFRRLFWWIFAVFAIGQIAAIFDMWVVEVLGIISALGTFLGLCIRDKDAGALATTMVLAFSVFVFLIFADVAIFFHLGWLQGVCIFIITCVGVGCGLYDFEKFIQKEGTGGDV